MYLRIVAVRDIQSNLAFDIRALTTGYAIDQRICVDESYGDMDSA